MEEGGRAGQRGAGQRQGIIRSVKGRRERWWGRNASWGGGREEGVGDRCNRGAGQAGSRWGGDWQDTKKQRDGVERLRRRWRGHNGRTAVSIRGRIEERGEEASNDGKQRGGEAKGESGMQGGAREGGPQRPHLMRRWAPFAETRERAKPNRIKSSMSITGLGIPVR